MEAAQSKPKKRLGDRLLDAGLISQEQLELALLEQKRSGKLIGAVLHDLGFVTEQEISALLAQVAETDTVDLENYEIETKALSKIPFEMAKELSLIPLKIEQDAMTVAMADPLDVEAIDKAEKITQMLINVVAASGQEIHDQIDRSYDKGDNVDQIIQELMKVSKASDLNETTAPIIRLANVIFLDAVERFASDIHIEPDEKAVRIRFRIDGVLQPYVMIPKDLQDNIIARIKVMSGLDVSETRLPQDGRMHFSSGRRHFNLRISSLPTSFGESIVARVLDNSGVNVQIESLGMRPCDEEKVREAIKSPYGLIIVTGPTGSGKTTTLYTALKEIDKKERSVFTLEDPIEYRLEYTRQTQVNEKIGLTFDGGLRTLLRQDPDVIFVGETRDTETAQLLVRAALTGHLVLSSMHTNTAAGAVPRLLDLGIEPSMLASTLRLVLGQRLARRLCPDCKEPTEDLESYRQLAGDYLPADVKRLWKPVGCPSCFDKGYKGRIAIFETLWIDEEIKTLIPSADIHKIERAMREKDMNSLFQDGIRRAIAGETSVEEVFRVASQD